LKETSGITFRGICKQS